MRTRTQAAGERSQPAVFGSICYVGHYLYMVFIATFKVPLSQACPPVPNSIARCRPHTSGSVLQRPLIIRTSSINVDEPQDVAHLGIDLHVAPQHLADIDILHAVRFDRRETRGADARVQGGRARNDLV